MTRPGASFDFYAMPLPSWFLCLVLQICIDEIVCQYASVLCSVVPLRCACGCRCGCRRGDGYGKGRFSLFLPLAFMMGV